MYHTATDSSSLMLLICWACLSVEAYICPVYRTVFPTYDQFRSVFVLMGFTFVDGLLDVVRAGSPPALSFFESLPSAIPRHAWGVYVLVLKKPGYKSLIYVGSGTEAKTGIRSRLRDHATRRTVPSGVEKAYAAGYTISHSAVLAHCPLPSAANVPLFRLVVLALEAAFSCFFWAMRSRTKSYSFDNVCPWSRDAFTYGGLCSHSSLMESTYGLDFTAEELEAMAATSAQHKRDYDRAYGANLRANPTEAYKESQRAGRAKHAPKLKINQQAAVQNKTYHCDVCNVSCRDNASLELHNKSPRHIQRADRGTGDWECAPCNLSFKYKSAWDIHVKSKTHLRIIGDDELKGYGKYYCDPCNVGFTLPGQWEAHIKTGGHIRKTGAPAPDPEDKKFHCTTCDKRFGYQSHYDAHCRTQKHIKKTST
ncbi:hypothetical protein BDY17DRAFT_60980 [Neohortaea acidophila]|uniref:C2H2-type domain-containing protein n=1 Tax=Neohortaea acidophila TaxID=245834 RepID=A0A6A6PG40_9PEZI|nr:uncharacterized protein BDY17DRAFT_60980 [Neohortaea acidophila]KAF2478895.1 hypothetical protein BDY17DRAFT_60980 [Neohortaea acidophila]